jgi:type IV pilus assembly protein PilV
MTAKATLRAQSGFSLLEVLVTLVILSLGILGVAGLQNVALKNAHSALLRAQAAQYAYDMLDRMRVNRAAAAGGAYNRALGDPAPTGSSLADSDRAGWLAQLRSLPEGAGGIVVDANGTATITVRWDETAFGNSGTDANCPSGSAAGRVCFVLSTRL